MALPFYRKRGDRKSERRWVEKGGGGGESGNEMREEQERSGSGDWQR